MRRVQLKWPANVPAIIRFYVSKKRFWYIWLIENVFLRSVLITVSFLNLGVHYIYFITFEM